MMSGRLWWDQPSGPLVLALLLASFTGNLSAESTAPVSDGCCGRVPALSVGLDVGVVWARTDEIVESLPGRASAYLSHLAWTARPGAVGVSASFRSWDVLRMNGGVRLLTDTRGGRLVNLDYLDPSSDRVTHRSVSASDFHGYGWNASIDLLVMNRAIGGSFIRAYGRLAYRGNYHFWKARGGEYQYPGQRGRFDDDEAFVRYVVVRHAVGVGGFLEIGSAELGLYARVGGVVSPLSWIDDRDTHFRRGTDYYNTYRWGWHAEPEIAAGVGVGKRAAVEAFYQPSLQFEFGEARTRIKTSQSVYTAAEKPNYGMTLHRFGMRVVWSVL